MRKKPSQLIVLSVTISNIKDIADWLNCQYVNITNPDVKLKEEIWYSNIYSSNTIGAVNHFLGKGYYPILVFTMTKPQAINLANEFSQTQQQYIESLVSLEQLELVTEPT